MRFGKVGFLLKAKPAVRKQPSDGQRKSSGLSDCSGRASSRSPATCLLPRQFSHPHRGSLRPLAVFGPLLPFSALGSTGKTARMWLFGVCLFNSRVK